MMSELAAANRVLYVNPPRSLRAAAREVLGISLQRSVAGGKPANVDLYQESIFLPAWGKNHTLSIAFNRVTESLRLRDIRRWAERHGFRSPLLWSFNPLSLAAVGVFQEKLVVYCVLDNYEGYFSPNEAGYAAVRDAHREMLRRADVVFAVSDGLLEQCLEYNQSSYLVPNGVDYELFRTAMRNESIPSDVRPIPKPILGFVGVLQATVDFELMDSLARSHPEWSLMVVGPVDALDAADMVRLKQLQSLPNVYYLGGKPPEAIPEYVNCCDVGLIPYRMNELTRFVDPQKLYEYLACGKPVVSTAIPSVRRFVPLVALADNALDFVASVARMLVAPERMRDERVSVARDSSWEGRIAEMSMIVTRHLSQRPQRNG